MVSSKYVYAMQNVSKTYPGGREVLKNITLAFLPGAKIGVWGIMVQEVNTVENYGGTRSGI